MRLMISSIVTLSTFITVPALAAIQGLQGSDTLKGAISEVIEKAELRDDLEYLGGGTGKGFEAILAGKQAIAPSSREVKKSELDAATAKQLTLVGNKLARDGVGVYVKIDSKTQTIDLDTLKRIFTCEITKWENVPGSVKTGAIEVYRRDDASGTTDAFKSLVGITTFGACANTRIVDTAGIKKATSEIYNAIGYAGQSGLGDGNRELAVSKTANSAAVKPSKRSICDNSYPLSRDLIVYEAQGAKSTEAESTEAESTLLEYLKDKNFMKPILENQGFFVCQ